MRAMRAIYIDTTKFLDCAVKANITTNSEKPRRAKSTLKFICLFSKKHYSNHTKKVSFLAAQCHCKAFQSFARITNNLF